MHHNPNSAVVVPDIQLGEFTALTRPLAGLKGALLLRKEDGREGRKREGKGKEMDGRKCCEVRKFSKWTLVRTVH